MARWLVALMISLSTCVGSARAQEGSPEAPAAETVAPAAATPSSAGERWGAIVLSFGGDAPEALAAEARDGATAALTAQSFTVLPEAEVAARIPPARLREAASIDALRAIAVELGVESVVTVAVWTSGGAADSVIVSIAPAAAGASGRSYSATISVGEAGLMVAARDAALGALERRTRAALLEGGTGHAASDAGVGDDDDDDAPADGEIVERDATEPDPWAEEAPAQSDAMALFGIIGPGLMLAVGAAGIGLGIYAVLDENCTVRGRVTGVCLMGDAPNVGLGVALMIGGVLAAGGAAIWWITGATTSNEPRIDGVAWHDGGMLRVRGAF